MYVQATQSDLLRKKVQEVCDRKGMKCIVINGGESIGTWSQHRFIIIVYKDI